MNVKVLVPLMLAPLIGILIGVQLFREYGSGSAEPGSQHELAARQMPGGSEASQSSWSFAGFLSPFGTDSAATSAQMQGAFEAALQAPPGEARMHGLQRAFTDWLLAAPDAALAHIVSIPPPERRTIITAAMAMLAHNQPSRFQRYAAALGEHGTDLAAVVAELADKHPAEALALVRQHPQLDVDGKLTAAVLPALTQTDVALAAKTVAAMNERAPVSLIQQVASAYGQHDPAKAYAWVRQMVENRADVAPGRLLDDVSSSLAASNPPAAEEYMSSTTDPAIRQSLLNEIALRKSQDDLETAWTWLDQYTSSPGYAEVAQNVLYRWSYTRPQEVARLLPQVSDATVQAAAAAHLTRYWQKSDQSAYQNWIASLPPGQLRTSALSSR